VVGIEQHAARAGGRRTASDHRGTTAFGHDAHVEALAAQQRRDRLGRGRDVALVERVGADTGDAHQPFQVGPHPGQHPGHGGAQVVDRGKIGHGRRR
jgi:hypothetical protein